MIKDNINKLIMDSMKNHDNVRTEALRAFKTAVLNWESAKENVGKTIDEATELNIIKKLVSQYKDTAAQCNDGKHDELVKSSLDTAKVLEEFLPAPVTEEQIRSTFDEVKENLVIESIEPIKKNMGIYIKNIKQLLPGADGKMVAKVVSENLK